MKSLTPEFSRPLQVAKLPNNGSHKKISADRNECAALAKRMQIPAIHGLESMLLAKPWRGGGIKISGELTADVEQVSVISLENFRETLRCEIERYFMPQVAHETDDVEHVIDRLEGGVIDLGEIVAETLALELDPYPRKPGEAFAGHSEDMAEQDTNPFSKLASVTKGKPGK